MTEMSGANGPGTGHRGAVTAAPPLPRGGNVRVGPLAFPDKLVTQNHVSGVLNLKVVSHSCISEMPWAQRRVRQA